MDSKFFTLVIIFIVAFTFVSCSKDDDDNNVKHEYVDLGLPSGTLWATCNVVAANQKSLVIILHGVRLNQRIHTNGVLTNGVFRHTHITH